MELEKLQRQMTEIAREIEKGVSGASRKIWKVGPEGQICRWEKTGSKCLK